MSRPLPSEEEAGQGKLGVNFWGVRGKLLRGKFLGVYPPPRQRGGLNKSLIVAQ